MDINTIFSLKGKVALVTGGTGVLGGAMAIALAKAGAHVAVLGRNQEKLDEMVATLKENGAEALALSADVTKTNELQQANEKLLQKFGKLDILINGAGGNMPGAVVKPEQTIFDLSEEAIRKIVELNYLGTVLPTQIFSKSMSERKEGVIINISSVAATKPLSRVMGYASSKAAIENYTQWLSGEMATKFGEGIRVNAIAPGFFLTEQNRDLLTNKDGSLTERGQQIISQTPFNRFGDPEDLSGTLIWLCSDASKFVTGAVIPVDGGYCAFGGI